MSPSGCSRIIYTPGSSVDFPHLFVQFKKRSPVSRLCSQPTIRHVGGFRSIQSHIHCLLYVHLSFSYAFLAFITAVMSLDRLPNGLQSVCQANGFIETSGTEWLVQKFGGTSIGKFPLDIVENVVRRVTSLICAAKFIPLTTFRPSLSHGRVAIVCSARSSKSKSEGTTNR